MSYQGTALFGWFDIQCFGVGNSNISFKFNKEIHFNSIGSTLESTLDVYDDACLNHSKQ